jgi:RHS repeat-associated protein
MTDGTFEHMRYFLTGDLQGSITLVTDNGGRLFEHLEYFPGGEIWIRERSEIYRQPHLYAGMYREEFRNLYRTDARWYEPREGMFLSPDPLLVRQPGSAVEDSRLLADYTYAHNNPTRYVDPTGHRPKPATVGKAVLETFTGIEFVNIPKDKPKRFDSTTKRGRFANRLVKTQEKYSKVSDFINDFWSINFDVNDDGERETKFLNIKVKKFQKVWKNQAVKNFKQSAFAKNIKSAGKSTGKAVQRWSNSAFKGIKTAFTK